MTQAEQSPTPSGEELARAWFERSPFIGLLGLRLVSLEPEKRLQSDVLLTYLVNPGTSLFVGYTDREENLAIESTSRYRLRRTNSLGHTGRQFFVKLSYLFRL